MATTTADNIQIIGGVDTHQDLHTAAVVSHDGTVLGTESFSTTRAGYRAMLRWFRSHGELLRVGVESTGTYGAGITRHFMRTLALPDAVEQWSLTTLREKLVKIGAKFVSHGRYVTFQLAEVAVPRSLFQKILSLIDDLRRRPAPA